MTIPEHEAQAKLRAAIEQFAKDVAGPHAIATDHAIVIAVADMNMPASVTQYYESYKGPMHALMGLNSFQHEQLKSLNKEDEG